MASAVPVGAGTPPLPLPEELAAAGGQEAEDYLERVAERLRARSLQVRTRVVADLHPAAAILREAAVSDVDLVALATHGRRGLSRLFLGSVADKVVRGAAASVLLCRPLAPLGEWSRTAAGREAPEVSRPGAR